jgi:hypothetical protein
MYLISLAYLIHFILILFMINFRPESNILKINTEEKRTFLQLWLSPIIYDLKINF